MKTGSARSGRADRRAGGGADRWRSGDVAEGLKKRVTCILSLLLPLGVAIASPAEANFSAVRPFGRT
jgi:hypothetical protein